MKTCSKCNIPKNIDEFSLYYSKLNNKNYRRGVCKECIKIRKKENRRVNKESFKKKYKKYCEDNKDKIREIYRNWYAKNVDRLSDERKSKLKTRPWLKHYFNAKKRCRSVNADNYKYYGGRGIKFLMTKYEFETLWFRDEAYNLEQPSIDRRDPDGHYEFSNCRFIEYIDNSLMARRSKKTFSEKY